MAGFIFTLGDIKENEIGQKLAKIILEGKFGPYVKSDNKNVTASVLADFCSMRTGDNVYFFSKRKIYGVGQLVCVESDCKYKNYKSADKLEKRDNSNLKGGAIIEDPRVRWFCLFEPSKKFFRNGVDMDDALKYRPSKFRMLRTFEKKTFIKVDEEENQALKEVIYLKNRNSNQTFEHSKVYHEKLRESLTAEYLIDPKDAVRSNTDPKGGISSEMVLEAALLDKLQKNELDGMNYDYLSHQVIASPFKPSSYTDKMDIFGYRYLKEFPGDSKPVEEYVVLELKKDNGDEQTILQLMRYVDWICGEYASGDYSRIKAYTVAHDYPDYDSLKKVMSECKRSYLSDTHPNKTKVWNDVNLLQYQAEESGEVTLSEFVLK